MQKTFIVGLFVLAFSLVEYTYGKEQNFSKNGKRGITVDYSDLGKTYIFEDLDSKNI